jgi:hypothetical protein
MSEPQYQIVPHAQGYRLERWMAGAEFWKTLLTGTKSDCQSQLAYLESLPVADQLKQLTPARYGNFHRPKHP